MGTTPDEHHAATTASSITVWRTMLEIHAGLIEELSDAFATHGLSVSEFDVLVNIAPDEGVRHKDLACRVVLTRSALTRLVDRLIGRGLVVRSPDDVDGRGIRVSLTQAGTELRQAAARANAAIVRRRFAALDRTQLDALSGLLHHLLPKDPS